MPKLAVAQEPPEEPKDVRHLELGDGSRLTMLPYTWQAAKASLSVAGNIDESIAALMGAIEAALIHAEFANGRPLELQPARRMMELVAAWRQAEDDAALPKANAGLSETPS